MAVKTKKSLSYKQLSRRLSPNQLPFKTTDKVLPLVEFIGQERALSALNFGIDIKSKGYNIYAMGPSGIGKHSLIKSVLTEAAAKQNTPPDWCYLHNFEIPDKPIALELAPGLGLVFQADMKLLIDGVASSILTVFESDEYHQEMQKIRNAFNAERRREREKSQKKSTIKVKIPRLYKQRHENEKALQLRLISNAIDPSIQKLKTKYADYPMVTTYLDAVKNDISANIHDFIKEDECTSLLTFSFENPALLRYKINLLVDNSKQVGAPIIFESTPTYPNLISRIEHTSQQGTLSTNFTLIRGGALHKANGGYLIIEARKLKKDKEAWEALKSALYSQQIKIDSINQEANAVVPISLEPMPIPLNIKIILLGDRNTYYSLCQRDHEFVELFKVPADFDDQIARDKKNITLYARLISTISKKEKLLPFNAGAVASIIDYSTRLAEDIEKLSMHIRDVKDLIIEANYWAKINKKKIVTQQEVNHAAETQIHRTDRSREVYYEDITRDFIIIKTAGKEIGQVNCLSVRRVGNFSYGHPTRVTARVRAGKGKILDIQREIRLAGPFHSKAGLTIDHFLASLFNPEQLFSISASLAFEQIYCWTDGDSASVGEVCALLSALAEIPVNQSFAVTGSIDQYGEVQAIGGVNEKIEGFFDVCNMRKLTGKQGVIIPAINQKNLMLKEDVVNAVKNKKFFIYAINHVNEAIPLLMNMMPGERNKNGFYPKNSLYNLIEERLNRFIKNRFKGTHK